MNLYIKIPTVFQWSRFWMSSEYQTIVFRWFLQSLVNRLFGWLLNIMHKIWILYCPTIWISNKYSFSIQMILDFSVLGIQISTAFILFVIFKTFDPGVIISFQRLPSSAVSSLFLRTFQFFTNETLQFSENCPTTWIGWHKCTESPE